jgi:hypothetical protein
MDALKTAAIVIGRLSLAKVLAGSKSPAFLAGSLGGWAVERRALRSCRLAKEARAIVNVKDALMAGSVLSTLALRVLPARGRAFRGATLLDRAFLAGAVVATAFIPFALLLERARRGRAGWSSSGRR